MDRSCWASWSTSNGTSREWCAQALTTLRDYFYDILASDEMDVTQATQAIFYMCATVRC